MTEANIAVLFFLVLAMVEVVKLAVGRVFKKTIDTDYQTLEQCRKCREECHRQRTSGSTTMQDNIKDLGRSIDLLRGILLVLAVKVGVDDKTLQQLASRKAEE